MSDLVGINVTKGQGISQAIQAKLGGKEAITHKENWNSVMELVKQEQADNGQKIYDSEHGEDVSKISDKSANSSNFVVHEGLMVIAQSVWNKIVELLTGKVPEQAEPEDSTVDPNPPAKDENPPVKDENPPTTDPNPPKEDVKDAQGRGIKLVDDDGSYMEYVYGDNGKVKKTINRNADGSVKDYVEYTTDGKEITRNADGSVKKYMEIIENEEGNPIEIIWRNADGTVRSYKSWDEQHSNGNYILRDAEGKIIMKKEAPEEEKPEA